MLISGLPDLARPRLRTVVQSLLVAVVWAVVLAWLGWRIVRAAMQPAPALPLLGAPQPDALAHVAAQHWFGEPVAPTVPPLHVQGVFASSAGAFAVAGASGAMQALRPGDEVAPGWAVSSIEPGGVWLQHGAARHFIALLSGPVADTAEASAGADGVEDQE